jgi:hypothetical protein
VRSPAEIAFRLRQESANLRLYLRPPGTAPEFSRLPLPDPAGVAKRLAGTPYAAQIESLAEQFLERRFPLLGYERQTGRDIHWRRDYVHGIELPALYFRRIPYLDFKAAGDHKVVWELNRHQHLVALAQASLLTGRPEFLADALVQMESWLDQNPLCGGINWASALEVAFRALSWMWVVHLAGDRIPPSIALKLRRALSWHGCFLEYNLSIYFSPNTHLQGEALALHALGLLFANESWRRRGAELLNRMIRDHVHPDGGHFEQSSYYHVYATDMFLFHAVLEPPDAAYRDVLRKMARYLWALSGSGRLQFFGDDDGGRLFHPYGDRSQFARGTLAACSAFLEDSPSHGADSDLPEMACWWLGDRAVSHPAASRQSEFFPNSGTATMIDGEFELEAPVRGFAKGGAGHSHAHGLQITLSRSGRPVLIDPGTYTYVSDPAWRNRFRGTAAHNTVRIGGLDQADPTGPFRWANTPVIEIVACKTDPWMLHARCLYRGLSHSRRIIFRDQTLWVIDDIAGTGTHLVEQFWHPAGPVEPLGENAIRLPQDVRLVLPRTNPVEISHGGDFGWSAPVPGVKHAMPLIRISAETELPCRLVAAFDLRSGPGEIVVHQDRLAIGSVELAL